MNEATIEIPNQWYDRSVNIFSSPPSDAFPINVVVSRDWPRRGQSLADYAEEKLDELQSTLNQYALLERRQVEVAGRPCLEAEYKWRAEKGLMHQWQTFIPHDDRILVITFTAGREFREEHKHHIEGILSSLQFENA